MAMTKIAGNTYLLFLDSTAVGTTYDTVICLTTFNLAGTTAVNDDSTMCGSDTSPGNISGTIAFTGKTIKDPTASETSAPDIFDLWQNKTQVAWKIGPVTPATKDFVKAGKGFLSAYGENYDTDQTGAFSGTISIDGPITQTITP